MKRLLYTLLFAFFIVNIAPMGCKAQVKNSTYRLMLKMMYKKTVPLIGVKDLQKQLGKASDVVLLDTREKQEFEVSHLPNAKWVGYDDFGKKRVEGIDKDQAVVVYCSVGYRSERIGEQLQEMGYTNVQNLEGGMFEWVNQDQVVVDKTDQETKKVHAYSRTWGLWIDKGKAEKVFKKK